jgi:hypothetical protein
VLRGDVVLGLRNLDTLKDSLFCRFDTSLILAPIEALARIRLTAASRPGGYIVLSAKVRHDPTEFPFVIFRAMQPNQQWISVVRFVVMGGKQRVVQVAMLNLRSDRKI